MKPETSNSQTTFSQALGEFLNSRDMLMQAARMNGQGSVAYKQWAADYGEKAAALDNFLNGGVLEYVQN